MEIDKSQTQKCHPEEQNNFNLKLKDALSTSSKTLQKNKRFYKKAIHFFNLELLSEKAYLNAAIGLALFCIVDLNFAMILPFAFQKTGFTKSTIASFLSLQAIGDVFARFLASFVCDRMPVTHRSMFIVCITLLAICRIVLIQHSTFTTVAVLMVISGCMRGACYVTAFVPLANSAPVEKSAAAFGFYLVMKGIVSMIVGPSIGYIRDLTGSYTMCVYVQSSVFIICAILWVTEYFVLELLKRRNR